MSSSINQKVELKDLYQEVILEHYKRPRFKGRTDHCEYCQEGKNPLCGDMITIYCSVDKNSKDNLLNLHFEGSGCSISQASASIMCEALQNVNLERAKSLLKTAEDIYTGKQQLSGDDLEEDMEALSGVSKFPVRIKCAALPWKTLELLITENFDEQGYPKPGCDKLKNCVQNNTKKLKVVSTENEGAGY
jgi:nitrogen fixation NifU-like protein